MITVYSRVHVVSKCFYHLWVYVGKMVPVSPVPRYIQCYKPSSKRRALFSQDETSPVCVGANIQKSRN